MAQDPAEVCVWHKAFSRCQMHRPSGLSPRQDAPVTTHL